MMSRIKNQTTKSERTPVDDVRRVRERLSRRAGGNVHVIVTHSQKTAEKFCGKLGLKVVPPSKFESLR
jgi:pyruvate/2-oxoglutarate/acetoin dehydrogenase E1 component